MKRIRALFKAPAAKPYLWAQAGGLVLVAAGAFTVTVTAGLLTAGACLLLAGIAAERGR
ncbi:hypothetical protein [Streptomyces smyrnaeus]|uniref:hypothetical protein n=1 Tax=Streptomyces smyrnaeus TaxID=1387713 RepID=UPI0036CC9C7D